MKHSNSTPEQDFWKWFQDNEAMLFDFEKDQDKIFDQLCKELHKVHSSLTFEFGPKENGVREFVISAGGIREAFPKVESLFATHSPLPRWTFTKFRPRRKPLDITFDGFSVQADSVRALLVPSGTKRDITLYVPGYSKSVHKTYVAIAFLLLDEALGEYDVETLVGRIDVRPGSEAPDGVCSLEGLTEAFDQSFSTRKM